MPDLSTIVSQMRAALAVSDPELDTSVGSVTRKILDAVAEPIAESYTDQHMLAYTYDVDSKIGDDLDSFCLTVGGIARLDTKRASGVVTFSRGESEAVDVLTVPVNTQVGTGPSISPQIIFVTTAAAALSVGVRTLSVPVQAMVGGPSGNVGAGLVDQIMSPLTSIPRVTNPSAMTGGLDPETDVELRERWKRTAFRSMAGTESMFTGIALSDPDCNNVNVVGASKFHREQIQILGTSATSQIDDAAYIYPDTSRFGYSIDTGDILIPGHDYTFNPTIPPSISNVTNVVSSGDVLDLEYEYVPKASRNDPANGISGRVDVYCAGIRPVEANQSMVFRDTKRFMTTGPFGPTAPNANQFLRMDGTHPRVGNVFLPLAWGPILTLPSNLSVGGTGFVENIDYWIVHDDSAYGYTPRSLFGIEWNSARLPRNNSVFSILEDYTYNEIPMAVQTNIDRWRLVAQDVQIHSAKMIQLRFNIAVVYERTASIPNTNDSIRLALATFLTKQGFAAPVQVSDILQTAHNVAGVDNVRMLNSTDDPTNFAIQQISPTGTVLTTFHTSGRAKDVLFGDSEIPVFHSLGGGKTVNTPAVKAANSFGVF